MLNRLCWVACSCVDAMPFEKETKLFMMLIKQLLKFCKAKKGRDSKSAIASMLMFTIRQYHKHVRRNKALLQTIVNKCFEFIHDPFPGIQDMAVETFHKLAITSAKEIYELDNTNYFDKIISDFFPVYKIITTLQLRLLFLQAICHIIYKGDRSGKNKLDKFDGQTGYTKQLYYIQTLNRNMNEQFLTAVNIIVQAFNSNQNLNEIKEVIVNLREIIQFNEWQCDVCKELYILYQFNYFYPKFLELYVFAQSIIIRIQSTYSPALSQLCSVRQDLLKLLANFVHFEPAAHNYCVLNGIQDVTITQCTDFIRNQVFLDYANATATSRDEHVLLISRHFLNNLDSADLSSFELLLDRVFSPTLETLKSDQSTNSKFKEPLYLLVKASIIKFFDDVLKKGLLSIYVTCLIEGIKDQYPQSGIVALETFNCFIEELNKRSYVIKPFLSAFLVYITENLINVMIDGFHSYGLNDHARILLRLLVCCGQINTPEVNRAVLVHIVSNVICTQYQYIPKQSLNNVLERLKFVTTLSETVQYCNDIILLTKQKGV